MGPPPMVNDTVLGEDDDPAPVPVSVPVPVPVPVPAAELEPEGSTAASCRMVVKLRSWDKGRPSAAASSTAAAVMLSPHSTGPKVTTTLALH